MRCSRIRPGCTERRLTGSRRDVHEHEIRQAGESTTQPGGEPSPMPDGPQRQCDQTAPGQDQLDRGIRSDTPHRGGEAGEPIEAGKHHDFFLPARSILRVARAHLHFATEAGGHGATLGVMHISNHPSAVDAPFHEREWRGHPPADRTHPWTSGARPSPSNGLAISIS